MGKKSARRYPRYEVQDVEGTFLYNLQADVINLSLAGMALETAKPLDIGRHYMFTIRKDNEEIKLPGKVAWCTLHHTSRKSDTEILPKYHAGIHFDEVLTAKAQALLHLIEETALVDLNKRLFGRFKPNGDTSVSIDSEVEFAVHKISLCGMLIETAMRTEVEASFPMELSLTDKKITFKGRVAYASPHSKADTMPPPVHLGIEFIEISQQDRKLLENFIASIVEQDQPPSDTGR